MAMKNTNSKVTVYVHRTKRMVEKNKKKFLKSERPRIEVGVGNKKAEFTYADEFSQFIINNFKYGKDTKWVQNSFQHTETKRMKAD